MTNSARNKQRRYGSNGYALEYPEFGQLLVMLLEFLANYFKSMFPNLFQANPATGAENDDDNDKGRAPAQQSMPSTRFDQTATPSMTASRTQTSAATPAANVHTHTTTNKPTRR